MALHNKVVLGCDSFAIATKKLFYPVAGFVRVTWFYFVGKFLWLLFFFIATALPLWCGGRGTAIFDRNPAQLCCAGHSFTMPIHTKKTRSTFLFF